MNPVTPHGILAIAQRVLEERGQQRDQPGGERTIPSVIAAFNAITGHRLTEQQGWLFMALVKVRRCQTGTPDLDHYVDGAAYFALAGEAALREPAPVAESLPVSEEPERPPCGRCDGGGWIGEAGNIVRCTRCGGAGFEYWRDCPQCEGTGLVPGTGGQTSLDCPACLGRGEVPR